jgi:glycosyltransferase involved in cell wall biosynthesis
MAGVREPQRMPAPWPNGSMIVYPDEPLGGRIGNLARTFRQSRWVKRALRQLDDVPLDVILVRNDLVNAFAAARRARRLGIPFVYQLSSPDAEFTMSRGVASGGLGSVYPRLRGRYGLAARRWVSRRATAVLAISESMRTHLVAADGLDPQKVFSFPMGVLDDVTSSPEGVEALRRRLNLPTGRTLVYSGVLDPVREPEWMLDVLDLVRARVADAVLLVVANNADERRRAFEAEARRRQADIRVVGPVPFRDVSTYLRCADVALAPYPPMMEHKILSPTKSLEGLCAGVPVVGSAEVDEHVAILEPSGGGVSVPWDKARFADAIVSLLENPDRRRRMGEQGRRWVLEHRTYAHLTEYLERILDASRRPAELRALPRCP